MEIEDPYQCITEKSNMTSKAKGQGCKVDASDRRWPISRVWKVLEIPKSIERLPTSCAIMRRSFKVKGQRSRSSDASDSCWPISRERKVSGRKVARLEHVLSTAMVSYKGLVKLRYCTWAGNTVSAAPATATQLVNNGNGVMRSPRRQLFIFCGPPTEGSVMR